MIFSHGSSSRLTAKNVSTIRSTIAPIAPQNTPQRRCFGGRLRQASAITTALSPDNRMLMTMISSAASQNCGVRIHAASSSCVRARRRLHFYSTDCSSLPISAGLRVTLMPRRLHHRELLLRRALAAGDDRAGVAHALAGRRGDAGDEADDRLLMLSFAHSAAVSSSVPPISPIITTASVSGSSLNSFRMSMCLRPLTGSPPMPTARRLAEAELGQLPDRFVGERARARHDADAALAMDVPRHDADLDLVGRDDAGAVRPEQQRLPALHPVARADHVAHRDAFGDADDEIEVRVDRLVDRRGGERRRHVDHRHGRAGGLLRFLHRRVDRNALEVLARLSSD